MRFTCFYLPTGVHVPVGETVQCQKHIAMATCAKVFYKGNAIGYLAKSSFQKYLVNGAQGFDENFVKMMNDTWMARVVDDMIISDMRAVVLEFDIPGYVKPTKKWTMWFDKKRSFEIGDKLNFVNKYGYYTYKPKAMLGQLHATSNNYYHSTVEGTEILTEIDMLMLPENITAIVVAPTDVVQTDIRAWIVEIEDYDYYVNGSHLFDVDYTVRIPNLGGNISTNDKLIIRKVHEANGEKTLRAQVCGQPDFGFIEKDIRKLLEGTVPLNTATIIDTYELMTATIHQVKEFGTEFRLKISLDYIQY